MALNYAPNHMSKEFMQLIYTIRLFKNSVNIIEGLEDLYSCIPSVFGIPKMVLCEGVLVYNSEYEDAKDWIDEHAGWRISNGKVEKTRSRVLQEKFG